MPIVSLGIGSNLGSREERIRRAIRELSSLPHSEILTLSSLYETEPVGVRDQPWFLNACAVLKTELSPQELLLRLKGIESRMGREEIRERWGPRLIDLDILLYDSLTLNSSQLIIPHPRLHQRGFVLRPLAEIAPEWRHPVLGEKIRKLAERLPRREVVRWKGKLYA